VLVARAAAALFVLLAALVAVPRGVAARAADPPRPSSGLLALPNHPYALIQLARGSLAGEGAELVSRSLSIWRLPSASARRVLPRLLAAGAVRAVEPDRRLRPLAANADPLAGNEWWLTQVGADRAIPPGPGRPLTIIDTGLDAAHPEFVGRPNTVLLNAQRFDDSDLEWHGTAVSSLAAAPENGIGMVGVYPQAVLRMWDGGPPTVSRVIGGLDAAARIAPGVVNLSLGFEPQDPGSRLLADAVAVAFKRGVVLVAAAGNDAEAGSRPSVPANLPHVLTVASTDAAGRASAFSSISLGVDLAAPGEGLFAAQQQSWGPVAGTSFASPIVAAATAWVWTVRPQLEKTQVFQLLRTSARDIGATGFDPRTGFGMLDIPSALTRTAPTVDPQEPNDDIRHVRSGALFRTSNAPVTSARRGRASRSARLDAQEDPEDVYRVWVPAGRVVRVTVTTDTDVDAEFWDATTTTVFARGAARQRHLVASSSRRGRVPERLTIRNRGRGYYGYLDVFLREGGPLDADYRFTISTARR
jgi:hypothetical protein